MSDGRLAPWWTRIKVKMLAFGITMSILPIAILGFSNLKAARENLEAAIQLQNSSSANKVAEETDRLVGSLEDRLEAVSATDGEKLLSLAYSDQERVLYSLLKNSPYLEEAILVDGAGRERAHASRRKVVAGEDLRDLSGAPEFQALRNNKRFIGPVYLESDGRPMVDLAVPVRDLAGRRSVGGLVLKVSLRGIWDNLSSLRHGRSGNVYVVDRGGRLIGHDDFSQVLADRDVRASQAVRNFLAGRGPADLPVPNRYVTYSGREVLGVYTPVKRTGWGVVVEQPVEEAYAPIRNLTYKTGLAMLFLMAAATGLSVFFALRFTRPIEILERGAKIVGSGDLTHVIQARGQDEIDRLIRAFNEMTRELKRKSDSLLREKDRLDTVVSGIGAGLALVGPDLRITWVNRTLGTWLEAQEQPAGGYCYRTLAGREDRCPGCPVPGGAITAETRRGGEKSDAPTGERVISLSLGGRRRIFRHKIYDLGQTGHDETGYLLVVEDITQRREMEAMVMQADKLAAIGVLASGVSHEINNPLAAIAGYSEDLLERLQGEDPKTLHESGQLSHYLKVIREQATRCKKITQNLLNFARESRWEDQVLDLNSLLEDVISLLTLQIKGKGVSIIREFNPGPVAVLADPSQLQQVFLNLLGNALDAVGERGEIRVTSSVSNGAAVVEISDNGPGITDEDLKKIFDPFFTTKPAGRGTGLGLSICYGIVTRLGGTITVQSQVGSGTTVKVGFPVHERQDPGGETA